MAEVALFYLPPTIGGGSTSFTAHLYAGFQQANIRPLLYRVRPKGEDTWRQFAKFKGIRYRNITMEEAVRIARVTPSLLTAPAHSRHLKFAPDLIMRLMRAGMQAVVHDPNEFQGKRAVYDHLDTRKNWIYSDRLFCIRPTMHRFFPKAKLISHPFVRQYDETIVGDLDGRKRAVSVARISFVKNCDIILRANRMVRNKKHRCTLHGSENRLYTRFKLCPEFPEFKQGGYGFPQAWGEAAKICRGAQFAVDMTIFPDDGGGSQYSFMEAWDAGAVNIIHKEWLRYKGEMKGSVNCIGVENASQLAAFLGNGISDTDRRRYVEAGYEALKKHDPKLVAQAYYEELTK